MDEFIKTIKTSDGQMQTEPEVTEETEVTSINMAKDRTKNSFRPRTTDDQWNAPINNLLTTEQVQAAVEEGAHHNRTHHNTKAQIIIHSDTQIINPKLTV